MDVKERKINVFVSSTFKDMQAEREELVKRIFPQLRKLCEERGVTWGEVDLRWGITDEQKAEGKVLPICLAEIEHCRPYFICMLGERYGWVYNEMPQAVIEQYEWLNEYKGKSVTELEILHGVLRNLEMSDHAFFYFRDPAYLNSIAENERIDHIEAPIAEDIQKFGIEDAEGRAEEKKTKLAELKKSIKNSGLPVRENYANPQTLGELVLQDLKGVIDSLYPKSEKFDSIQQARFEHETFAESRFNIYIERKEYFDRLDAHVKDSGLPLVVIGESGSGKSALFANWAKKYKKKEADTPFLLVHHIGATPDSMDWASMLRRIMEEMKLHFDIQQDIPGKPDELKAAFANWLHMTAAKGKMVLIIDALNQLEDRDGALELYWLPEIIPPNIRLVVSSLPGRSLDKLNKRGWSTLEVKPLDLQECKKLIVDYLGKYRKALPKQTVEHIASYNQSSNPLYLRALLEEIRLYGDHFTLLQRIDHYLAASTVDELYNKILERYEQDYNRDRKNLVKDAFSCLWASRKGLSHIELLEMLGSDGEPLPGALWSPLYLSVEKSLVNRSGLLSFSHDYFRAAVKKRYLETEDEEQNYHSLLASYFEKRELSKRQVDELPWQLSRAKSWKKLVNLLIDPYFFEIAWESNEFDIKKYWSSIEDNSEFHMVQAYMSLIGSPSLYNSKFISTVSILLYNTGHLSESSSLIDYLIKYYQENDNFDSLQRSLGNKALVFCERDESDKAMRLLKEQERICRELGNEKDLQASLGNQANILAEMGDYDGAMKLYIEQEQICNELENKDGLQASLGNQANILSDMGNFDSAMKLYIEQEHICRELEDIDNLQVSLGNQANILSDTGDLDGSMRLYIEQERICRELGNKDSLQRSLGNQATIFFEKGRFENSMQLLKEQERICRELGNKKDLQASLGNQGLVFYAGGNFDNAMELLKEQEHICRQLENKKDLQASLGNQALVLSARSDFEGAIKLHKEEERICRELKDKDGLQMSLGNQANLLYKQGDLENSMKLYKKQERICRELRNFDDLQRSLGSQALILKDIGDFNGALKLHKEEEGICRELKDKDSLQASLGNQANIFFSTGDLDAAMKLYKEQEMICIELENKEGLQTSLGNQAVIIYSRGDIDGSMRLLKEQEIICREIGNKDSLQTSLGNQAEIIYSRGNLNAAMKLYKEQERMCQELGNKEDLATSLINQALCLIGSNKLQAGLQIAEKAFEIAIHNGYKELAKQIEKNIQETRNKVK